MDPTSPPIPSSGDDRDPDRNDLVRERLECERDHEILIRNAPMTDKVWSLAGASLVIRGLPLGNLLRNAAKREAPVAPGQPPVDHPDAAAVLEECRRKEPDRNHFSTTAIEHAYVGLLQDRLCGTRLLDRFARAHPEVARRAAGDIAAILPFTHPGERLLVLHEIRMHHAERADCRFEPEQIWRAWRNVRRAQWRVYYAGSRKRCSHASFDDVPDANSRENGARLVAEETIVLLNGVLGGRDRRYLWDVVLSSGPWSESLIATLRLQLGSDESGLWMGGRELTKQERSKSFAAIRLALARLLARQEHPRLRSSPTRRRTS